MRPAVALVPGFFGFDHRESQTYFADRFIAGLRAALEARGHAGLPVVAMSTLGIASLYRRQQDLVAELRALETPTTDSPRLGGPRTWHLVGHSTGGVDAELPRALPTTIPTSCSASSGRGRSERPRGASVRTARAACSTTSPCGCRVSNPFCYLPWTGATAMAS